MTVSRETTRRRWIADALARHRPGALHRQLGIPETERIPVRTLEAVARAPGLAGKRARLALTLRRLKRQRSKA